MFNALRPDELLNGLGSVLRLVASKEGPLGEYDRSQALSAYSVTRLMAAEQAAAPALLRHTQQALLRALEGGGPSLPVTEAAREAIQTAHTGTELGDAVSDLLAGLPRDSPIVSGVHAALADMVDREVAALAEVAR